MSDNSDIEEIACDENQAQLETSDGLKESMNLDIIDAPDNPMEPETDEPSDIAIPDPVAGPSTITDTGFQVPSYVKNIKKKVVRREMIRKLQKKFRKAKKEEKERRKKNGEKGVPKTIESMREKDETTVEEAHPDDVAEIELDLKLDEMSNYFQHSYEPKVLITYSDNPNGKTKSFGRELCRIIPNSIAMWRNRSGVKKIVESCKREEGFTDIIIINEDMRKPNGLLLIHLPDGPTAHFRLSNVKLRKDLKLKVNHKEFTNHRPEVVLNNFSTRLGYTVSRMLAAIFHYDPDYKGRRAVTFHNQRDYIFFRHHRYEFKNKQKVKLRELGPRFTLKLRSLQHGTFDSKHGDYDWIISGRRHEMETSRRRFFL